MKKEDRNIYIENIDVDEAKSMYFKRINIISSWEEIRVLESLDRITYEAVHARVSSPNYNAAAMDGILVQAEATQGASEVNPIILNKEKDFIYVNTGNQVVHPYNAVIMIEDVIEIDDNKVKIIQGAYPWQHIRPVGEDIVATEMIIPSRHKIRPVDMGALIAGGVEKVKVYKKPRVGILPTGSEIVESFSDLEDGRIIDSNSRVFEGLTIQYGGVPNRYSPVSDDYQLLKAAILKAVEENDLVLINAGSSAGAKDFTVKLMRELGEVVVHGIAIKPGKPTILGVIKNKPVIGIPGYPVSSYFVFDTFAKPLIYSYTGIKDEVSDQVKATISKRIVSSLKSRELIRVNLGYVGDRLIATPLASGAGATMSLVKADGVVTISQKSEGIEAGQEVVVDLIKPLNTIKNTLVSIGSHDLIMDIIGDMMKLTSGHVGSLGGILSLRRNECHMSPIHLLDPDTGEYNISYIKKYFPGNRMALIKGVKRKQGFIVAKGNPYNIKDFFDLTKKNIYYVNRQRGAGTRILLDYNLNKLNIDSEEINGYQREMNTHMAVSMAVKSGAATTGLGILSAANAMDLDFVEVGYEDYDFLIPYEYLEDERVRKFINILQSQEFKKRVTLFGGYGLEGTGEIIVVGS